MLIRKWKEVKHELGRFSEVSVRPLDQEGVLRCVRFCKVSVVATAETNSEPWEGGRNRLWH